MPDDDVELMVSVADEHLGRFPEVVETLRKAGLRVISEQPTLGTLTGKIAAGGVDALASLQGVAGVEPAGGYQLPPPESDLQ